MGQENTQVIIIGGGIVGLSAALFLQHHNVSFILIEKHKTTSIHPRARGVNMRTMEMFREVGVEEEVMEEGKKRLQEAGMVGGRTLAEALDGFDATVAKSMMGSLFSQAKKVTPCSGARVTQDLLEPILLKYVRQRGGDARFHQQLVSFSQSEDEVTCTIENRATKQQYKIRAPYMIAADGANSFVRQELGATVSGRGVMGKLVNVLFKADLAEEAKGREFSICRIDREEVVGLVTSINLRDVWVFHIVDTSATGAATHSGSSPLNSYERTKAHYTRAECKRLIDIALGMPSKQVEVVSVLPWDSAMNVMDCFIHGRIYFAGDSAHQMPPWGGQGANSGIADVHNLAWKLAYVLDGKASPELLHTYQIERHPIDYLCALESANSGDDNGLLDITKFGGGGKKKSPLLMWVLPKVFPYLVSVAMNLSWLIGYFMPKFPEFVARVPRLLGYGSNYTNLMITDEGPSRHSMGLDGRPGTRAPHLDLEGKITSTLDLFGKQFVLLAGQYGREWCAAVKEINLDYVVAYEVSSTGDVVPKEGGFEYAAGVQHDGAILVRPDGMVGWRNKGGFNGDHVEEIRQVLTRLLSK